MYFWQAVKPVEFHAFYHYICIYIPTPIFSLCVSWTNGVVEVLCVNRFEIWLKFWKDHPNSNRSWYPDFFPNSKKNERKKRKKKRKKKMIFFLFFFQKSRRKNYNEFQNFPSTIGWYRSEVALDQKSCFFDHRLYLFTCRPFYIDNINYPSLHPFSAYVWAEQMEL